MDSKRRAEEESGTLARNGSRNGGTKETFTGGRGRGRRKVVITRYLSTCKSAPFIYGVGQLEGRAKGTKGDHAGVV